MAATSTGEMATCWTTLMPAGVGLGDGNAPGRSRSEGDDDEGRPFPGGRKQAPG